MCVWCIYVILIALDGMNCTFCTSGFLTFLCQRPLMHHALGERYNVGWWLYYFLPYTAFFLPTLVILTMLCKHVWNQKCSNLTIWREVQGHASVTWEFANLHSSVKDMEQNINEVKIVQVSCICKIGKTSTDMNISGLGHQAAHFICCRPPEGNCLLNCPNVPCPGEGRGPLGWTPFPPAGFLWKLCEALHLSYHPDTWTWLWSNPTHVFWGAISSPVNFEATQLNACLETLYLERRPS